MNCAKIPFICFIVRFLNPQRKFLHRNTSRWTDRVKNEKVLHRVEEKSNILHTKDGMKKRSDGKRRKNK